MSYGYAKVPSNNAEDDLRELDQSEKEYNRMISQHMTYHRTLMDDLMRMSSESGSGSGSGSEPRELLQQQISQANQTNIVRGIGTTIGNLNTTNQQLVSSAAEFADDTENKVTHASQLNNIAMQNTSKLNQNIKSYQALVSSKNEAIEGFNVRGVGWGNARAATAPTTSGTAPTTSGTAPTPSGTAPTPSGTSMPSTIDAALEVSDIVKESHKYALVIFAFLSTYLLYKTLKKL